MPKFSVHLLQALIVALLSVHTAEGQSLRDPEALYLEGTPEAAPVILKVLGPAPVYASRMLTTHVGNLVEGDAVQLLAHHPEAFLVRLQKGKMEGWVSPQWIQAPDPAVLEQARGILEQEAAFQASIKKKEVMPGMFFEHVQKALGKPDSRTFRIEQTGRTDVWSYIDYETVIEQRPYRDPLSKQIVYQSIRVKIPVGLLDVEFKEGQVVAVERKRDTLNARSTTTRLR